MLAVGGWSVGGGRLLRLALLSVLGYAVYAHLRRARRRRERRRRWDAAGRDVVVLHQFARAAPSPNLSPFALKLETFLRMAGIRYVVDETKPLGAKAKCPWITLNGRDFTDTELIIDHLLSVFPGALPARLELSPEQHARGRAVQVLLDEHLVFAVAAHRYLADGLRSLVPQMAARYRLKFRLMRPLAARIAAGRLRRIGWARSPEQLLEEMRRDLTTLADLLGERRFLLGDEPTPYDATVFGHLTQLLTGCAPPVRQLAEEFGSLVRYFERVKARYWPDWDECRSP